MPMFAANAVKTGVLVVAGLLAASLAGCAQPMPRPNAAAVAAIPPGAARIWVYRDYEPSVSLGLATVTANGAVFGYADPDGSAFYRDIAPGHYHLGVGSYGVDFSQSSDVDLRPGQEAFVKIQALGQWVGGGDRSPMSRDTFYAVLMPPQIGQAELPTHPLRTGG